MKLYTIGCPKCTVLEKKLKAKGVDFEIIDNEDEIEKAAELAGVMSLPLLEVDGKILTFEEANKYVNEI